MLELHKTHFRLRAVTLVTGLLLFVLAVVAACSSEPTGPSNSGFGVLATLTPVQEAATATAAAGVTQQPVATDVPGDGTPTPGATTTSPAATPTRSSASATPTPTASPVVPPTTTPLPTTPASSTPTVPAGTATSTPAGTPTVAPLKKLLLERVFDWYEPDLPTHMEQAPDGTGRIFVSEQDGQIMEIIGGPEDQSGSTRTVLDISAKTLRRNTEEGLLGFALHPNMSENGHIYLYYSADAPRRSVISEFTFRSDGTVDPATERKLLEVSQPFGNHNGGMLAFGPDGFLYVSLGDGGSGGDPFGHGQNLSTLLGSILRIDVDSTGFPYTLPSDNPFIGETAANGDPARGEIWAYGLRNPWRFSFDRESGDLWTADVGQNAIEEVDLIVRGGNYGWNFREGNDCYQPSSGCGDVEPPGLIAPVATYSHSLGCSVTGGYVYRGERIPSLSGSYLYGDFCSGSVWALRRGEQGFDQPFEVISSSHLIPAFGQMQDGEVYVLTYSPGIFRFIEN